MRSRMIAFSLAVVIVCQFPTLPEIPALVLVAALPVLGLFCWHRCAYFALPAAFALGLCWAVFDAQSRVQQVLPQVLEEYDFWVTGQVRGLPARNGRAQQMDFWVLQSCFDLLPSDCDGSNEVFSKRLILLNYYGEQRIAPGQTWRWRVRLNQPHGYVNPGGFDYEAWLMLHGYAAKGYVRQTPLNQMQGDSGAGLDSLRFRLRERLTQAMAILPNAGTLLALIMGERGQISAEQQALYTATGTNHLIVISGLHVGFIGLLSFGLGNLLARTSPALLRKIPAQNVGAVCAIVGASAYSLLAGFALPTQRAVIMLVVFMGGQLLAREVPRSLSFWLAMSLVLLLNPMSPAGAGFWLSFSAVATLLFALGSITTLQAHGKTARSPLWRRAWARWHAWAAPQWAVFIGLSVPLLLWTAQISLFSPLANLLAIPLVSLLVVPFALFGAALLGAAPSVAMLFLSAADALLTLLQFVLAALVGSSGDKGVWQGAFVSSFSIVFAVAACLLCLLPKGWPGRRLAPILLLPVFWPSQAGLPPGRAQLWILDVGQGLAIVVRTATHVVLYDTGPAFSGGFDAGSGVVLPFLRQQGIAHIDHLIISHSDNDHQGGLRSVLNGVSVGKLSVSSALEGQVGWQYCQAGQAWEVDGVSFEFLMPHAGDTREGNDGSCVLRVDTGGHSALLTGDIERAAENALVAMQGAALRSTVVIAPHHGSQSSSTPVFVEAVQPVAVVYSAAYRSQFGHPAPQVAALYAQLGVCAWNTAISGAILFELEAKGTVEQRIRPQQTRQMRPRYWQLTQNAQSKRLHGLYDKEC